MPPLVSNQSEEDWPLKAASLSASASETESRLTLRHSPGSVKWTGDLPAISRSNSRAQQFRNTIRRKISLGILSYSPKTPTLPEHIPLPESPSVSSAAPSDLPRRAKSLASFSTEGTPPRKHISLRKKYSLAQLTDRVKPAQKTTSTWSPFQETALKPMPIPALSISPVALAKGFVSKKRRNISESSLPAWDRTVDMVFHQYSRQQATPDKTLEFARSIDMFLGEHGRLPRRKPEGFFVLPPSVRFKIWGYVIERDPSDKPVNLTTFECSKQVWRHDEFTTLKQSLKPLSRYLAVSFDFRADALVAFLMTRRFHVTYSAFVGPGLNPLATTWLDKYGPYIQDMALELDMTQFGFGDSPDAQLLGPATTSMAKNVESFVRAQARRESVSTMKSLVVLCRRYYGERYGHGTKPNTHHAATNSNADYYKSGHLTICNTLECLRGLLDSVRICGFTSAYTHRLVKALFTLPPKDQIASHAYQIAPSTAWPRLPGQRAWVDAGDGSFRLELNSTVPEGWDAGPWGANKLSAPVVSPGGETWIPEQDVKRRWSPPVVVDEKESRVGAGGSMGYMARSLRTGKKRVNEMLAKLGVKKSAGVS